MTSEALQSKPRRLATINGIIPLILVFFIYFVSSNYFFTLGYFIYGWVELLGLSTFVSLVPDVAHWYLFGISLVGGEATANLTITLLVLVGCLLILFGSILSYQTTVEGELKGRLWWLIGGILTFPLGILALYSFRSTSLKNGNLSLKERIMTELRKNKFPYILIVPAIFFLLFTYIIPILRGLYITFFSFPSDDLSRAFFPVDYSEDPLLWTLHAVLGGLQRQNPEFIGIDNFLELFSQTPRASSFQNALDNNVYFVILFVPGVIIVSLALAVLLNSTLLKGQNTYTTIFYLPVITSVLVVAVIWLRVVFPANGLLTLIVTGISPILDLIFGILNLITLGIVPASIVGEKFNWLSSAVIESVALMSIWRSVGFDVLILLAGLKSIPSSLYESARVDGHGSWSQFRNITLPMLKGPLGVVIILELINGWQIFQEFYGLNLAQFGGDQSLAIYLIANYANPRVMTFASTVGYFIFGMTAFIGLLGRIEIKNILKGVALFSLLAILFNIPSNRATLAPKSLGLNVDWMTFDILFLSLTVVLLLYYIIYSLVKYKQLEKDTQDLRVTGFFLLFVTPFYLLNGYDVLTQSGAGSTPFIIADWLIPSGILGILFLIVAVLMISAKYLTVYLKKHELTPFLFPIEDNLGG